MTPATRRTYIDAEIRAKTLADGDVISHEHHWREVLDVWADQDRDLAIGQYDGDEDRIRYIEKHLTDLGLFVIARILIEQPDSTMIEDELVAYRSCDLVTIQVPSERPAPYWRVDARSTDQRELRTHYRHVMTKVLAAWTSWRSPLSNTSTGATTDARRMVKNAASVSGDGVPR